MCCITPAVGNGPAGSQCATSCGDAGSFACRGDPTDCPNNGVGWSCDPIPGTPPAGVEMCVPFDGGAGGDAGGDGGDGGSPEAGTPDTGTPDSGTPDSGAPDSAPRDGGSGG
jgi:hypothetical protein